MKNILIIIILISSISVLAQNTMLKFRTSVPVVTNPFSDVSGWWRADTFFGSSGSYVFNDLSNNANNMSQSAGTLTPGTAANGKAMVTASSATLNSNLTINSWPLTVVTVGKRSNNGVTGFFGGRVNNFSDFWYGYESSNSYNIDVNFSIANTTSEAGSDACYIARVGYGGAVPILNGIIQPVLGPFATTVKSNFTVSIGTTYRALNMDWYETMVWNRVLSISELDYVHNYVNQRYGMSIPLSTSYTPVTTIAFGGQSNADGRGRRGTSDVNIPIGYRSLNSSVFDSNSSAGTGFSNMNLSTNTIFATTTFGPELSAAQDYAARISGNVYVIKTTLGSTSMSQNPGGAGFNGWGNNGYWTHLHTTSQNDFFSMFTNYASFWWNQLRVLQSSGKTITEDSFKGLSFWQGEDDAVDVTASANWSSKAQAFFSALRSETGLPNQKIYLIRINSQISTVAQPYRDIVRAQQDACAALLGNCQEVSCDSYTPYDGAHLDYDGQLGVGSFLATQY